MLRLSMKFSISPINLICLSGFLAGCGNPTDETRVKDAETAEAAEGLLSPDNKEVEATYSGTAIQFSKEFVFRNGKLHTMSPYTGEVKILDDNANALSHEFYNNGKLHGLSTRWWQETGNKKLELTYENGKPNGQKTEWFQDGTRKLEQDYLNGIPHGVEISWHPNGQKRYERQFVEGKPDGTWTDWDEKGNATRSIRYEVGKVVEHILPK